VDHRLDESPVVGHLKLNATTYTLAATHGDLSEQLHHLVAREGEKAHLVLKGCHVEHIAYTHIAFRQRSTNASHVVNAEGGLLVVGLSGRHKHVTQEV